MLKRNRILAKSGSKPDSAKAATIREAIHGPAVQTAAADWLQIVRGEFSEMPGLHLTKKQVQQLWGLDCHTCDTLLGILVDTKFLRQTPGEGYVRANIV